MLEPDATVHVSPHEGNPTRFGPDALQILMTEHWSLLSSRSLGYTEAMSRASIFVAALTGSVVALALVGQATDFGNGFVAFALVLLPVVFFLGVVTIARIRQINWEDATWVQGMNRIRNAYLDLAPELERYFVTSKHDDAEGVLISSLAVRRVDPRVQGFLAIPGVISVLDSVLAGATAAIAAHGLGAGTAATVAVGIAAFALTLACFVAYAVRAMGGGRRKMTARFPGFRER
jgi:hypothetical protein